MQKYIIIIDKSEFLKVGEVADMIAMTVTGKAMQHANSLMEELGFLAVTSCNLPINENLDSSDYHHFHNHPIHSEAGPVLQFQIS